MERNVKELKIWMIRNDLRVKDIVAATGQERSYVNKTLLGYRNNRVVLQYLLELGCPADILGLPADITKEAA